MLLSLHLLIWGTELSRLQGIGRWNDRGQMTPCLFDPWIAGWLISLQSSSSYGAGKNPQKKFTSRASVLGGTLDWESVNCYMSPSMANWTVHNSAASAGNQTDVFIERDINTNSSSSTIEFSARKKISLLITTCHSFRLVQNFLIGKLRRKMRFCVSRVSCTTA